MGQSCGVNPAPTNGIKAVAAPGYHFSVVANGLTNPRSIQFDDAGNLLVLQVGQGIVSLRLDDAGGICVWAPWKRTVVSNTAVSRSRMAVSSYGTVLMLLVPAQSRNGPFDRRENLVRVRP